MGRQWTKGKRFQIMDMEKRLFANIHFLKNVLR